MKRLTDYRIQLVRSIVLVFAVVTSLTAIQASADSVTQFISHDGTMPQSYGVYEQRLFFVKDSRLFRVDSVGQTPVEVPTPTPLLFDNDNRGSFAIFGDDFMISIGGKLFRLRDADGALEEINTLVQDPDGRHRPGITPRITSPFTLTVHDGSLYFFAYEPLFGCDTFGEWMVFLYRLEAAAVRPEMVRSHLQPCSEPRNLTSTDRGLVFVEETIPNARYDPGVGNSQLHIIPDPRTHDDDNPGVTPQPVAVCGAPNSGFALFGDDFYFSARLHALLGAPDQSNPGPIETNCQGQVHYPQSWQSELGRYKSDTGVTQFYDIHWLSTEERRRLNDSLWDAKIGASNPRNLVVANDVLYFQATANGADQELYRKTLECPIPQPIALNANAASEALPLGEFLGRLWFIADTGTGKAIHYLEDDGVNAVPLAADIRIAENRRNDGPIGFVEFDGGVVFSAKNSSGEPGTYIARIDRASPPPSGAQPCLPGGTPDPRDPSVDVKLTVNGSVEDTPPGRRVRHRSLLTLRCDAVPSVGSAIASMRVSIWEKSKGPSGHRRIRVCKADPLDTRTVRCTARVRAKRGSSRYWCNALSTTESGETLFDRANAYVFGVRPKR